jgi:hypothetical protein
MLTEYITAAFTLFGIICFVCVAGRVICTRK